MTRVESVFLQPQHGPAKSVVAAPNSHRRKSDYEPILFYWSGKERSLIQDATAAPIWARFYEIKSNRPSFCDRDGVIKYDIEEIGNERRGGYSWYGNWGEKIVKAYAKWPHRAE